MADAEVKVILKVEREGGSAPAGAGVGLSPSRTSRAAGNTGEIKQAALISGKATDKANKQLVSVLSGPRSVFNKLLQGEARMALNIAKIVASSIAVYEILNTGFAPAIKMISNIMKIIGFFFIPLAIAIMKLLQPAIGFLAGLLSTTMKASNSKNPVEAFLGLLGATIIGALGTISVVVLINLVVGAIDALGLSIIEAIVGPPAIAAVAATVTTVVGSIAALGAGLTEALTGGIIIGGLSLLEIGVLGALAALALGIAYVIYNWQDDFEKKAVATRTASNWTDYANSLHSTNPGNINVNPPVDNNTKWINAYTTSLMAGNDAVKAKAIADAAASKVTATNTAVTLTAGEVAIKTAMNVANANDSLAISTNNATSAMDNATSAMAAFYAYAQAKIGAIPASSSGGSSTGISGNGPTTAAQRMAAYSGMTSVTTASGNTIWGLPGSSGVASGVPYTFPSRASGGLIPVTGPYLMHGGETVNPVGSNNGGGTISVIVNYPNINSSMDVKQVAKDIARQMQLEMSRRTSLAASVM